MLSLNLLLNHNLITGNVSILMLIIFWKIISLLIPFRLKYINLNEKAIFKLIVNLRFKINITFYLISENLKLLLLCMINNYW